MFPFVVALPSTKPGDPEDRDLRERDHAAVGREEDQARRDDPEEEHLRQQRRRPSSVETIERRESRASDERDDADDAVERDGGVAHAGLPKRPSGRTASTIATSTNVKMIE